MICDVYRNGEYCKVNWIILKRCETTISLETAVAAGATDYKFPLAGKKLDQALRFCVYPPLANCIEDFLSLASLILTEENLRAPKNMQEAKSLFLRLITVIDAL